MIASAAAIIAISTQVLTLANMAIQAGNDAAPFFAAFRKLWAREEVTQEDLDALRAEVMKLADEFDLPLPPEDPAPVPPTTQQG